MNTELKSKKKAIKACLSKLIYHPKQVLKAQKMTIKMKLRIFRQSLQLWINYPNRNLNLYHFQFQSLFRDQHLIQDPPQLNLIPSLSQYLSLCQDPALSLFQFQSQILHQAQTTGPTAEEPLSSRLTITELIVGNQPQSASTVASTMMKINVNLSGRIAMKMMAPLTTLDGHPLRQTAVMKLPPVSLMRDLMMMMSSQLIRMVS